MRKTVITLALTLLLLTACSWNRSGEPVDVGPEAFYRANLARTGVFLTAPIQNPQTTWAFQAEAWVDTAPAVAENVAYFGSYDGNIYAVDAKTGAEIWRFATNNPVLSSPAVSGEIVYVGGLDAALYALNRNNGENIWRFATQGGVLASPAVANGLAYVGSEGGIMYAVNINNGQEAWHIEAGDPILFPAAVADGLMLFGDVTGKVTAVQAINGEQVWQMQIGDGYPTSGPAVKNGVLYILLSNEAQISTLYAIDLATQSVNWSLPLTTESYAAPA
ncbi:MAG: PQQ-binding-like beta-propeller repeat protein, partial [Anaerolineae bacterium]|nr:PQQ-binding-like beta-propeller repeat protein [Anaerolineae bacterium]